MQTTSNNADETEKNLIDEGQQHDNIYDSAEMSTHHECINNENATANNIDNVTLNSDRINEDRSSEENDLDRTGNRDSDAASIGSTASHDRDRNDGAFSIDANIADFTVPNRFKNSISDLFIILQTLALAIRGKMTYTSIISVFQMIKSFTINSTIPNSLRKLWTMLSRNDDATSKRHWYCQVCLSYIGQGKKPSSICQCGMCGPKKNKKKLSYFIEVKIRPQLEQLFADPAIVESLAYRFTRRKLQVNSMEDIYDSNKYKELCQPGGFLDNQYNFSFSIFTDGVKVSNSSKASAWPIMLMINEFSPHAHKRYILLAGIWVDKNHPNLQCILQPTIRELITLHDVGIEWRKSTTNELITSKFVTVIVTADSKARAPILSMTQGNGKYGCTYCYHAGEQLDRPGVVRVYPNEGIPSSRRTDAEIRYHMMEAYRTDTPVFGVQSVAAVMLLPQFDLGSGAPVDSMHNVYLGVAKFHTELILHGKASNSWYAGSPRNIAEINSRLLKIRPPSRISRVPRRIEAMSQWKASEWRNWIQYYVVPCFKGIVDAKHVRIIALLSRAVYILNQSSISAEELSNARMLIKKYVQQFEKAFGKTNMRYNIHLLNHLADSVQDWGPFWTHSAIPYEAFNKKIIDNVTSPNSRCLQIVTRYCLKRFIENSLRNSRLSTDQKKEINKALTQGLKKKDYVIDSEPVKCRAFKEMKKIGLRKPSNEILRALSREGYPPPTTVLHHQSAILMGTSRYACEPKKKNSQTQFSNKYMYCKTFGYCKIKCIITFCDNSITAIHGFIVERLPIVRNYFNMENIKLVRRGATRFLRCDENLTISPAIQLHADTRQLDVRTILIVAKLPNVWETD